jgi:hypothetical protein
VIEDSVRKDAPPEKTNIYGAGPGRGQEAGPGRGPGGPQEQMEGLACPRGAAASPQDRRPLGAPLPQVQWSAVPSTAKDPASATRVLCQLPGSCVS